MRVLGKGKHVCHYLMQTVQIEPFATPGKFGSVMRTQQAIQIFTTHTHNMRVKTKTAGWNQSRSHVTLSTGRHMIGLHCTLWGGGGGGHQDSYAVFFFLEGLNFH